MESNVRVNVARPRGGHAGEPARQGGLRGCYARCRTELGTYRGCLCVLSRPFICALWLSLGAVPEHRGRAHITCGGPSRACSARWLPPDEHVRESGGRWCMSLRRKLP